MKKFSIEEIDFDYLIIGEKSMCAKFQIVISKTEDLVRVYTNRWTNIANALFENALLSFARASSLAFSILNAINIK